MELTSKDIELARRYIICRSAIKGLMKDKEKIKERGFELEKVYLSMIERALVKVNDELRELHKYPISVKTTGQPTVYEVSIGKRYGYVEINIVEITKDIEKLMF